MLQTLRGLPSGSVVLLHASCHNPTGVDLSREQWQQLIPVIVERGLIPFVDMRSEEHTSELQSQSNLVCRLLLEKKKKKNNKMNIIPYYKSTYSITSALY